MWRCSAWAMVWATTVFVLGGCAAAPQEGEQPTTELRASRASIYSKAQSRQADFTAEEKARIKENCVLGMPKVDKAVVPGQTHVIARDGYVLEHSSVDKIPLWVCEHVTKENADGQLSRSDKFRADDELPPGERAELSDYKYKERSSDRRARYDRGHQAPAGNQNRDERMKDETFFLSNMCPQDPPMNSNIWRGLEEETRQWAIASTDAYIVTGPMFYDPREDDASTADGSVDYITIGSHGVAVPTHFYKIFIRKDPGGGGDRWSAVAFVMENRAYASPHRFEDHVYPISWIEDRTGINFFPELTDAQRTKVETRKGDYFQFHNDN
jgi:endonuclease G